MATRSPVVVESSSPELHGFHTSTPQPNKRSIAILSSSSPDLPHASAFFKSHTPGLTTGSRSQQVPRGVSAGFASAASLWKAQKLDTNTGGVRDDEEDVSSKRESGAIGYGKDVVDSGNATKKARKGAVAKTASRSRKTADAEKQDMVTSRTSLSVAEGSESIKKPSRTSTGKLKTLSKAGKSADESRSRSPLVDFAFSAEPSPASNLVQDPKSKHCNGHAASEAISEQARLRRASISLSEFDFRPDSPRSRGTASPLNPNASVSLAVKNKVPRSAAASKPARKKNAKNAKSNTAASDISSQSNSRRSSICLAAYQLESGDIARSRATEHDHQQISEVGEASVEMQHIVSGAGDIDQQSPYSFASRSEQATACLKSPKRKSEAAGVQLAESPTTRTDLDHSAKDKSVGETSLTNPSHAAPKAIRKRAVKKFTKSASIILNSDEPEQNIDGQAGPQADPIPPIPDSLAVPASKTKKAARKPRNKKVQAAPCAERLEATGYGPDEFNAYNNAFSQSAYFANDDAANCHGLPPTFTEESMQSVLAFPGVARDETPPPAPRPFRRRRSWTPAKNTETAVVDTPGTAAMAVSEELQAPVVSLAALVSGFNYDLQHGAAPHDRIPTGEAPLKKRRIELAHESAADAVARKAHDATTPAKRVKGVKKKPLTITDQATKAYRTEPVADPSAAQPTVSDYFAPQKETLDPCENEIGSAQVIDKPAKTRKPRKRRIKIGGDPEAVAAVIAKKAQKKVKKVKIQDPDVTPPLFSPDRARAVEKQQGFLFGTSSQLEVDDSPSFILQMQAAIRESEATAAASDRFSPRCKSCAKVPTAPHGTSLSVGQAERGLWCTASRNQEGDVLAIAESRRRPMSMVPQTNPEELQCTPGQEQREESHHIGEHPSHDFTAEMKSSQGVASHLQPDEQTVVDLCNTSPAAHEDDEQVDIPAAGDLPELGRVGYDSDQVVVCDLPLPGDDDSTEARRNNVPPSDDSWMLLSSDGAKQTESQNPLPRPPSLRPVPALPRSATSPTRMRAALQALDGNTSIIVQPSPPKFLRQRPVASATSPPAQKRPRGRPRKDAGSTENIPPQSKPRGRAPKDLVTLMQSVANTNEAGFAASQDSASSGFVNIDEIYDSDPPTPSPPRRRAASTPPSLRRLELTMSGKPVLEDAGPAIVTSMLKYGDPQWTTVSAVLFPQITKVVKAAPPSNDMVNPSWYEKMLLYDPIVLEDLTGWLNGQGLRVETRKIKAKSKKKGKKKKDGDDVVAALTEVAEYETVQEELKPWMVQKWCEENSICCLWREGLRGGVKVLY